MADIVVEAPITLEAPFLVIVEAPITLEYRGMITVEAPITLEYRLPVSECTTNNDCPIGYVCKDGICVLEGDNGTGWWEELQKWIEDNWAIAAGCGLGVGGLILMLPNKRKRAKW